MKIAISIVFFVVCFFFGMFLSKLYHKCGFDKSRGMR